MNAVTTSRMTNTMERMLYMVYTCPVKPERVSCWF